MVLGSKSHCSNHDFPSLCLDRFHLHPTRHLSLTINLGLQEEKKMKDIY